MSTVYEITITRLTGAGQQETRTTKVAEDVFETPDFQAQLSGALVSAADVQVRIVEEHAPVDCPVERALGVPWSETVHWSNSEGVEVEVHLRHYADRGEGQFDVILTDSEDPAGDGLGYGRRAIVNITPDGARALRDALDTFLFHTTA